MNYGLSNAQLETILRAVKKHPEVDEVILFGSRAQGTQKTASDIDLALKGKNVAAHLASRIKNEIEEESTIPFFIDTIAYQNIHNAALRTCIDTEGVRLWKRERSGSWGGCSMSKISTKLLGDVLNLKRGYDLPANQRTLGPYPVISSAGVSGYHNEYKAEGEGVITGRYGTLGEMHYINGKYWPHNTALYVTNFKNNHPKYIYYLLCCLGRIRTSDKSAVPGVNRNELHGMAVPIMCDKNAQQNIAAVLSTLDAKIDCNNRINVQLEAIAKTLYDYWFVQFDFPDTDGKPYKTSGGKMVYNAVLKRDIPQGWGVEALKNIEPAIVTGKTPSTANASNFGGEIPFITIGDVRKNIFVVSTEVTLTKQGADAQWNKYIPEDALCVTCIATTGLLGFSTQKSQTNQQINTIICQSSFNRLFLYFTLKNHFLFSSVAKTGNTFANMNKDDFSQIQVIYPSINILSNYEAVTKHIYNKIKIATKENQHLAKLRDFLLPMLMNGQVGVV